MTALWIGAVISAISWKGLTTSWNTYGDFGWAYRQANLMLRGKDAFSLPHGVDNVPYPLTTALFGIPFSWMPTTIASALFMGISCALLSMALTRERWTPLVVFASYPFWAAVLTIQWSPLLLAAALTPWLYPIVIAKPNIGLPISIRSFNRTGAIVAAVLVVLTLLIQPNWPLLWWQQTRGYQSFIPIVSVVGVLLLVALRWARRDADCRFLLLMSIVPQRWYYDALPLWVIPQSTAELVAVSVLSWGALFATPTVRTVHLVGIISTVFNYLPMLAIILIRKYQQSRRRAPAPREPAL